ncbi:MAG TPA: hypothetical protein VF681_14465 [Abditibacteriaceae bacterium]
MSWSLEIYQSRDTRPTQQELTEALKEIAPSLSVCEESIDEPNSARFSLCDSEGKRLVWVHIASFTSECDADSELVSVLEREISESDADDGDLDENYTARLKDLLRSARWHVTFSAAQKDVPEQETAVVRSTYAASKIGSGLIHDLQSGAWMDSDLFEEMLDAYAAAAPF